MIEQMADMSLTASVDMDGDYGPIVGDLHKFVLSEDDKELQKFLYNENGEEIYVYFDFANFFDQRDGLGRTPLQLALVNGSPSMVKALFDMVSKVKNQDWRATIRKKMLRKSFKNLQRDVTPLIVLALSAAVDNQYKATDRAIQCIRVLINNSKKSENSSATEDLLKAKASFRRGVLHYACQIGDKKLIVFLLNLHKEEGLLKTAVMEECGARKLPLQYAVDSNDKESIKILLHATLGKRSKEVQEGILLKVGQYCARRSLFLFFDVCTQEQVNTKLPRQKLHKRVEIDFSKRILSPRKRANPGLDIKPQTFSSDEYINKLVETNCKDNDERSTAILTDKVCYDHLQMPKADGVKRYTVMQTYQENPHRLEVIMTALRSLGEQLCWDIAENKSRWVMSWISKVHTQRYIDMVKQSVSVEKDGGKSLEDDYTDVSRRSFEAAKGAVRGVLNAVDAVMKNENIRNAFAAVRPPGHHIGPDGMTNVNLEYDRKEYLGNCIFNNAAIAALYALQSYPDKIKRVAIIDFDIHHGNGSEKVVEERKNNIDEEWFYASIHGYGGNESTFYPGSGRDKDTDSVVNVGLGIREKAQTASSRELRSKFRRHVTKGLNAFKPDFVFISAGFDGHENCYCHATNFKDEDYTWMTEEIMTVANRHCSGRIVSVLEGGYNTRAGYFSPLAQSTLAHVNALKNYSSDIVVFKPLNREFSGM